MRDWMWVLAGCVVGLLLGHWILPASTMFWLRRVEHRSPDPAKRATARRILDMLGG